MAKIKNGEVNQVTEQSGCDNIHTDLWNCTRPYAGLQRRFQSVLVVPRPSEEFLQFVMRQHQPAVGQAFVACFF